MMPRTTASLTLPLLVLACSANAPVETKAPEVTPAASPSTSAMVLDATAPTGATPMTIAQWKTIQAEGKAAAGTADIAERIAASRAFIAAHPNHQETPRVLEALADALLAQGNADTGEVADVLARWAELDRDTSKPVELCRKYHLEHGLPLQRALALLELGRSRIADEKARVQREEPSARREWRLQRLAHEHASTHLLEAQLRLQHEQAAEALAALDRAEEASHDLPHDLVALDAEGREVKVFATGSRDPAHLLRAAALAGTGDAEAAKAALSEVLGFLPDLSQRKLLEETRQALGVSRETKRLTTEASLAGDFALEDLEGKTVRLSDLRGKVTVIAFWAMWCGPCKEELPVLQKFVARNRDKGVELLTINIDDYASRAKIRPFLEAHDLKLRVLLEDPKQLTGYNYQSIPALYVIDREGRVAHARTGYDPQIKAKLEHELQPLIDGERAQRQLVLLDEAPAGFGIRWKQPVQGDLWGVGLGPAMEHSPAEVAAVGRDGLSRWSDAGEHLATTPLGGWTFSLEAADLDGDGHREWIAGGWQALKVIDDAGALVWEQPSDGRVQVAGVRDLDADGFREIVVTENDRVAAFRVVPDVLWRSEPVENLETVVLSGDSIAVQAGDALSLHDGAGMSIGEARSVPTGRVFAGTVTDQGRELALLTGLGNPEVETQHDIDGDGAPELIVTSRSGIVAYAPSGDIVLSLRTEDVGFTAAIGDLDGRAGAEIALGIEHYGLVVLGLGEGQDRRGRASREPTARRTGH